MELPPLDISNTFLYPAASVIVGPIKGSFVCSASYVAYRPNSDSAQLVRWRLTMSAPLISSPECSDPDFILSFQLLSDNTVARVDKPAKFFEQIRGSLPDIEPDQLATYSSEHLLMHDALRRKTFAERHGKSKRDESNHGAGTAGKNKRQKVADATE